MILLANSKSNHVSQASHSTMKNHFRLTGKARAGITLVELMIAVLITLIIVAAMVRAFKISSDEISKGRAAMDMHSQMRAVIETLRRDLQTMTVSPRPYGFGDEPSGYFEYVEGPLHDNDFPTVGPPAIDNGFMGDIDDVLAMTVRSSDRPFRGRFNGTTIESKVAEVIWWATYADTNNNSVIDYGDTINLYRRVLLIRPDLTTGVVDIETFYADNDVSVRSVGGNLVMNSLEDLARRENRYAHDAATFPHEYIAGRLSQRVLSGTFEGEDLMLANVIGFDVKVFSPNAAVEIPSAGGQALEVPDVGFTGATQDGGGYIDLNTGPLTSTGGYDIWFAASPDAKSQMANPTFCTWTPYYEDDGVDQDGGGIDQGTNGLDDNGIDGVDDHLERETQPPYPTPIRSLHVSIRMLEPKTNQTLQKSVKESFVPN